MSWGIHLFVKLYYAFFLSKYDLSQIYIIITHIHTLGSIMVSFHFVPEVVRGFDPVRVKPKTMTFLFHDSPLNK